MTPEEFKAWCGRGAAYNLSNEFRISNSRLPEHKKCGSYIAPARASALRSQGDTVTESVEEALGLVRALRRYITELEKEAAALEYLAEGVQQEFLSPNK